ncbi:MAG: hypothetical protein ACRDC8_17490, partial [Aeromonas veronii]
QATTKTISAIYLQTIRRHTTISDTVGAVDSHLIEEKPRSRPTLSPAFILSENDDINGHLFGHFLNQVNRL